MNTVEIMASTLLFNRKTRTTIRLAQLSYFTLIVLSVLATVRGAPDPNQFSSMTKFWIAGVITALIPMIPLLIFVVGIIKQRVKTFIWLGYVSLMYFVVTVLMAFNPQLQDIGIATSIITMVLFICCLLITRWNKRQQLYQQQEPPSS